VILPVWQWQKGNRDKSLSGEFKGVAQQIQNNLFNSIFIRMNLVFILVYSENIGLNFDAF
jgi:hypothetical protein